MMLTGTGKNWPKIFHPVPVTSVFSEEIRRRSEEGGVNLVESSPLSCTGFMLAL